MIMKIKGKDRYVGQGVFQLRVGDSREILFNILQSTTLDIDVFQAFEESEC